LPFQCKGFYEAFHILLIRGRKGLLRGFFEPVYGRLGDPT
jgi:hypothetical protein